MSKFYYQGEIQQENFLTANDIFLRSVYGKYQLMILEAVALIVFGTLSLVIYFFDLNNIIQIPDIYARCLGAMLVVLAIINLSVYYFLLKKRYGVILKVKSYIFLLFGIILLAFPISLKVVIYRILAIILFLIGFIAFVRRRQATLLQNTIYLSLIVIGVVFMFSTSYSSYADIFFFSLMILLGLFILYYGIFFRKSLKAYEDEQKGFTDYRIE